MTKSRTKLASYSGHHIETLGATNLTCVIKNTKHNVKYFVTEMDNTAILGVEACQKLGLIRRLDSADFETREQLVPDAEIGAISPKSYLPIKPQKYAHFQGETAKDQELTEPSNVTLKRWPNNREDVRPSLKQHWWYKDEITCLDGLLFMGDKLIVAISLQSEMMEKIHEPRPGFVKCKSNARQVLFCPYWRI